MGGGDVEASCSGTSSFELEDVLSANLSGSADPVGDSQLGEEGGVNKEGASTNFVRFAGGKGNKEHMMKTRKAGYDQLA